MVRIHPFHRLPDLWVNSNAGLRLAAQHINACYRGNCSSTCMLLTADMIHTLINRNGQKIQKSYTPHNFNNCKQRYDRAKKYLDFPNCTGYAVKAKVHLIEAPALRDAALDASRKSKVFCRKNRSCINFSTLYVRQ